MGVDIGRKQFRFAAYTRRFSPQLRMLRNLHRGMETVTDSLKLFLETGEGRPFRPQAMERKLSQRLTEIVNALPWKENSRGLEIGCGRGAMDREIRRR